jgi:hypothetical protein
MPDARGGDVPFPRWLVIVRRDQNSLYESLALSFRFSDRVDVLVDRREDDARRSPKPIKSERRRRITARERALWKHVGFRLIFIPGEHAETAPAPRTGRARPRPRRQPRTGGGA